MMRRPPSTPLFPDPALFRSEVGWYVTRPPRPAHRLNVDPGIEMLARDLESADHDWDLNAELSAILSTALAVDAADRYLHPQDRKSTRLNSSHANNLVCRLLL